MLQEGILVVSEAKKVVLRLWSSGLKLKKMKGGWF